LVAIVVALDGQLIVFVCSFVWLSEPADASVPRPRLITRPHTLTHTHRRTLTHAQGCSTHALAKAAVVCYFVMQIVFIAAKNQQQRELGAQR